MELSVAHLVRQALQNQTNRQQANLATPERGAVEPHMAVDSLALEPDLAWQASLEVLPFKMGEPLLAPKNWPEWIERLSPTGWVLHALGEFPQRLDKDGVLEGDLRAPTLEAGLPLITGKKTTGFLLAAALFRQAGKFEKASALLDQVTMPALAACVANERAALAWQQGDSVSAEAIWQSMALSAGPLYNRALARCAAGDYRQASSLFNEAANAWTESSPWHHLARVCALTVGGLI